MPAITDTEKVGSRIDRAEHRAQLLLALRDARVDREALHRNEADLITWARDMGATWAEIGEAVGLSPTGARMAVTRRAAR